MTLAPVQTVEESILLLAEQFREVISQPNTPGKLRELDRLYRFAHELLARMEQEKGGETLDHVINSLRAHLEAYMLSLTGDKEKDEHLIGDCKAIIKSIRILQKRYYGKATESLNPKDWLGTPYGRF